METDYGKLGASFLHIINRLDLEIKQYFQKLQEMRTETKCHCEIFTLVGNDGVREKCLCSQEIHTDGFNGKGASYLQPNFKFFRKSIYRVAI